MTRISFIESTLCATRGIIKSISNERNIKIQIFLCSIIIFLALILEISKTYLITIIVVCFLVIILEMFNRGFEKLIDLIIPYYDPEAGRIKDIMAGVVLLTFIMTSIVSLIILYEPLINLFFRLSKSSFFLFLLLWTVILGLMIILVYLFKKNNKR